MESIEKALEKARQNRKARAPNYGRMVDVPRPFVYEQTRVESIPANVLRKNRIIAGLSDDPQADIFRTLRVQVLRYLQEKGGSAIGVCSPNPGVGKSFVAANLAVSLALGVDHTVLLVDADLRRPSLQTYFGLNHALGLTDYLLHGANLADCLVNPGTERLVLLPAGFPIQNSSEVLGSPRMLNLARELKNRYADRFVIYDLPPLLSGDDSLVFLPEVDGCILVIEERRTRTKELQRSLELLNDAKFIGTVLNKSRGGTAYHYYY